jgi:hypothetical protein
MSRVMLTLATIFFLLSVFALAKSRPGQPLPKEDLLIDREEIDLGELLQKQDVKGTFRLTNGFSQPLKVLGVHTSCGCAGYTLDSRELAPGESARLELAWNTETARNRRSVHAQVFYRLEDGSQATCLVTLKGIIRPDIEVDKEELFFNSKRSSSEQVQLQPGILKQFTIGKVDSSHRAFTATYDANTNILTVAFDATQWAEGDNPGSSVTLQTNSSREPNLRIWITTNPFFTGDLN